MQNIILKVICLIYSLFINETDSSYEGLSFTNGGVKHHQEGTPQRKVFCVPKSMGKEVGMVPCEEGQEGGRPNNNCITTIAGLLQNHAVVMETNSCEQYQQQGDSVEVCNENSPPISQPVKRTSAEDVNTGSGLAGDEVSSRPFKRRRKLIAANSQQERDREETGTVEENNSRVEKENHTEQITTPVNNPKSEDTDVTGSVVKKPFLTSTPNDATYGDDIDSSIEADTIVPSTVYHYKRRRVLKRAPAGDHVTVTGSDGTRVYLRLSDDIKKQNKQERPKRYQLLSVPFYQLRHEVESKVQYHSIC